MLCLPLKVLLYSIFLYYVTPDMVLQLFFLTFTFLSDAWFPEDQVQGFLISVSQEQGIISGIQRMPMKYLSECLECSYSLMPILESTHIAWPHLFPRKYPVGLQPFSSSPFALPLDS